MFYSFILKDFSCFHTTGMKIKLNAKDHDLKSVVYQTKHSKRDTTME